jgi:hypothetical protein
MDADMTQAAQDWDQHADANADANANADDGNATGRLA